MNLGPAGPIVAFHEEVRRTDGPDGKVPVLVGQNFYKPTDRFRDENGERLDKYVKGEFVINTVYGCQVVVTNPTSTRQRLSVLVQLPTGSIPVANAQFTKTVHVDLEPYRTQTVDYHFYFPRAGKFQHFPAHVAKSEKVVAVAPTAQIEVLEKPRSIDTGSWDYISQFGTDDEVFAVMNRENCSALNLDKIAFRMKDRGFFEKATAPVEEPPRLQRDAVELRPVPRRPRRGQGVPRPQRRARQPVRRADRYAASDHRSGRAVRLRTPRIQAAGERPDPRARQSPTDRQCRASTTSTTACSRH